jgi:hypothetical protein
MVDYENDENGSGRTEEVQEQAPPKRRSRRAADSQPAAANARDRADG